jgi:hypothetical protein
MMTRPEALGKKVRVYCGPKCGICGGVERDTHTTDCIKCITPSIRTPKNLSVGLTDHEKAIYASSLKHRRSY